MITKVYHLFGSVDYEEAGGMNDYKGSYSHVAEAERAVQQLAVESDCDDVSKWLDWVHMAVTQPDGSLEIKKWWKIEGGEAKEP